MEITKEQLENLYVTQRLSTRECAKILGLPTHGGVSSRLRKFGIAARPGKFQLGNKDNKSRRGNEHPGWNGGKKVVQCDACGNELDRFPSLIHDKNFCDIKCRSQWRSVNFKGESNPNHGNPALVGENNPNWQGGIGCEPYAPIWVDKRFKAGIRERDNHTCQNPECWSDCETLTIHHIDYNKKNCEPENLITLCISCNARANFNRDFWQAGYSEIIRLKYQVDKQAINH